MEADRILAEHPDRYNCTTCGQRSTTEGCRTTKHRTWSDIDDGEEYVSIREAANLAEEQVKEELDESSESLPSTNGYH